MSDVNCRIDGRAGRITLTRPQALNALTHDMVRCIDAALAAWSDDPAVQIVLLEADGARAFCAGGDIAAVWQAARGGDHGAGQAFFRDEYRMNARIADYPKPVAAFMHGFVMGGGVGLGGHASHRIVGETTQIAMPEAGIGLIPDVGGTWLLARAPGRIGEYLGLTGTRMGAGDALHAGFADAFVPEADWPALKDAIVRTGKIALPRHAPPAAPLADRDLSAFGGHTLAEIVTATNDPALRRNSPLSMAATLAMVRAARGDGSIRDSLTREHRFTHRATQDSDFLEGVRAQLIDKDRLPKWRHDTPAAVQRAEVDRLLAPLGAADLEWRN